MHLADKITIGTIDQVADRVLENIFGYFTYAELDDTLSYVCSRWKKVIQTMPKRFVFNHTESSEVVKAVYSFPDTFETISLSDINGDVSFVLRNLKKCQKNLRSIHLYNVQIVGEQLKSSGRILKVFLANYLDLEALSLKSVQFDVKYIIPVLPMMNNLRSLTIGDNPHLRAVDLQTIVLNCEHLDSIHLYELDILSDQDIRFMLCNHRLADKLKQLTLVRIYGLNMMSYEHILNCSHLERLKISVAVELSGETLVKIPDYLKELKVLNLEKVCGVSAKDFVNMFNRKMKLEQFYFHDCCSKFSDEAFKTMVLCLRNTITALHLRNCVELQHIDSLKQCKRLRKLDFTGCVELQYGAAYKEDMALVQSMIGV